MEEELPDSTVSNEEEESFEESMEGEEDPPRFAPKLFLKALPGGTFQSSPVQQQGQKASPVNFGKPPQLVPRPGKMGSGVTITRVSGTREEDSPATGTSSYLPTQRFLSGGSRNFLKPNRKALPGLTPITSLGGKPQGPLLQAKAGSSGTSITITKTVGPSMQETLSVSSQGVRIPHASAVVIRPVATPPGLKVSSMVRVKNPAGPGQGLRIPSPQIPQQGQGSIVKPIRIPAGKIPSKAALQMQIQKDFKSAAVMSMLDKGSAAPSSTNTVVRAQQLFQNMAGKSEFRDGGEKIKVPESESSESEESPSPIKMKISTPPGLSITPVKIPARPEEDEEEEEKGQEEEDSTRRTGRKRKPTKMFATDFVPQTRRRREAALNNEESRDREVPPQEEAAEGSEVESTSPDLHQLFPKVRGRPRGTGRGRGRPRGSTLKAKLERERAAMLEVKSEEGGEADTTISSSIADENGEKEDKEGEEEEVEDSGVTSDVTPSGRGRGRGRGRGASRGSPGTPRGARRGRGGRGRGSARALIVAKRRAAAAARHNKRKEQLAALAAETPAVFEEETRMSAERSVDRNGEPCTPQLGMDEEASNMSTASASAKKKFTKEILEERKPVTAETLFEYKWPLNNPDAEFYFLQEQIIEFLGHKSFRRKYPNLERRAVDMEERDFLREQKIVSETQCDLGLTAINSTEVLDILYSDFPDKYEEYRKIEEQRREKELTRSQAATNGNGNNVTRDRSADFIKRITRACSKWNASFNKDRKETRSYCFDLQSGTIHVPIGSKKVCPPEQTKIGYYPVAVLPGQFTDGYKSYTPVELKYLPLNTVMYGPIQDNHIAEDSGESESDSEGSSSSDESSSTGSEDEGTDADEKMDISTISTDTRDFEGICKSCNGDANKNKDGRPEILIHCAKCESANHPTCLELSVDMVPYIKKYNWQCTDCKNCIECNDPADEDKMLFCDCCDRGYHIYCVGLRKVPSGRWHCVECSVCFSCGVSEPSEDRAADWHHEYKKGEKGAKFFLHSLCVSCHKLFKKGQYCPVCLKVHLKQDDKSLLECRNCDKWVHKHCAKRSPQNKFAFVCDGCESSSNFSSRTKLPPSGRRN